MCGIFLTMSDSVDIKFMSNMFVMDALRGKDSCGLLTVTLGEQETYKNAVPALEFIKEKEYSKILWKNTKAAIGHNRAATAGVVNTENAHPFTVGNITGVHNGTLVAQWRLPDSELFEVDSKNIMHSIDKIGIDETWKLIDGAAALMWFNKSEGTINIIRNDERDLYMTLGPKGEVYAASEKFMLLAAMERNFLTWTDVDMVPTDTLITINVETRDIQRREVEAGEFPYTYSGYQNWGNAGGGAKSGDIGSLVNFLVDYIEHGSHCTYYYVSSTAARDSSYYTIEDYQNVLRLRVGDKGHSTVLSSFKGETFLSVSSTYEHTDSKDEDHSDSYCNWCSSPIEAGERYTVDAEGNTFCPVCSQVDEVRMYVGDQVTEVVA